MRISSVSKNPKIPHIVTLTVCFEYSDDHRVYDVEAEVEKDAPGSYTCVNLNNVGDVSDHLWRCIAEKAEEICWERENPPKNRRSGCDCLPTVDPLQNALHDDTCPLRLSKAEREVMREQERKEARR